MSVIMLHDERDFEDVIKVTIRLTLSSIKRRLSGWT